MYKGLEEITASEEVFALEKVCIDLKTSPREVNFYRKQGLLSNMAPGAADFIKAKDIARLKIILKGRRNGLRTKEIATFLDADRNSDFTKMRDIRATSVKQRRLRDLKLRMHEITLEIDELERAYQSHKAIPKRIVFPPNAPQPLLQ